jgi:hypothetical protein
VRWRAFDEATPCRRLALVSPLSSNRNTFVAPVAKLLPVFFGCLFFTAHAAVFAVCVCVLRCARRPGCCRRPSPTSCSCSAACAPRSARWPLCGTNTPTRQQREQVRRAKCLQGGNLPSDCCCDCRHRCLCWRLADSRTRLCAAVSTAALRTRVRCVPRRAGCCSGSPHGAGAATTVQHRVCCFRHLPLFGSPSGGTPRSPTAAAAAVRNPMIEVQITLGSMKALEEAVARELARK